MDVRAGDLVPRLPARFRVERLLGTGGQADVWLAQDLELDQPVAVKLFRPGMDGVARERLRREVRLGRELAHPRLVRMFELIEAGERPGVVMEWVPGGTLADRLKGGPLAIGDAVQACREVLEALSTLHASGVLHRDVKPSNVLVDPGGHVRLADFGLARPVGPGSELTRSSVSVGTPGYMSPEQLRGDGPGPAADLYGLGVTLFHLLTGRAPFPGSSDFDVARRHLTEAPPDPRVLRTDCPAWLARYVARLLQKRPTDRFATAAEALTALNASRGPLPPRTWKRRLLLSAAVAAGLVFAALIVVRIRSLRPVVVQVVPSGKELVGQGGDGQRLFAIPFRSPIDQVVDLDLGRYGGLVTIATAFPRAPDGSDRLAPSEIAAVDRTGQLLFRTDVEGLILSWPFPFPKLVTPLLSTADLTGDGIPELILVANQRTFYPSVVLVYWPAARRWEQVLQNEGHLGSILGETRDGTGRLYYHGAANTLGGGSLCGAIRLAPLKGRVATGRRGGSVGGAAQGEDDLEPIWTTLTTFPAEAASPRTQADGSFVLSWPTGSFVLDRFGNPVPGPLAGADRSRERVELVSALRGLASSATPWEPAAVASNAGAIAARFRTLLVEQPSRRALALVTARAVAAAGDVPAAIRLLRQTIEAGDGNTDVEWRLAHLEAAGGDLAGARRRIERVIAGKDTPRAAYDASLLLVRILVEERDAASLEALVQLLLPVLTGPERERMAGVVNARRHLWWDRLEVDDLSVRSSAHFPEGDALAGLARYRTGQSGPSDPEAMEHGERDSPDAASEFRLARTAALLGLGRPREALDAATGLVNQLRPRARVDFGDRQTLDLAEALRVKALAALGEGERTRAEAGRLQSQLRPGLLPRVLVDEALRGGPRRPGAAQTR